MENFIMNTKTYTSTRFTPRKFTNTQSVYGITSTGVCDIATVSSTGFL